MYLWGRRGCPHLVKTAFQEDACYGVIKLLFLPYPCVCIRTNLSVYPKCMPSCLCALGVFGGYKEGEIVCLVSEQQHDLTQWQRESQLQDISPFPKHLDFLVFSPPLFKPNSTHCDNEFRWRSKRRSKETTKWKNSNPFMLLASRAWWRENKLFFYSSSPSLQSKKHVLALSHVIRQLGWRFSQTFPAHDTVTRKNCRVFCFVLFLISVIHSWVVFYCSSFVDFGIFKCVLNSLKTTPPHTKKSKSRSSRCYPNKRKKQ